MRSISFVLALVLAATLAGNALAQEVAELYSVEGVVEARIHPSESWTPVTKGVKFKALDAVRTKDHSRAGILLSDGVLVRLIQNSTMAFKDHAGADSGSTPLSVLSGITHFFSREPKKLPVIETQAVSASVRGTEFVVEVAGAKTIISVINGVVDCANKEGSVTIGKGEQATTLLGQAPVKSILLSPLDAVQWALPYPAVMSLDDYADFLPGASAAQKAGFEALERGDAALAKKSFAGNSWRDVQGRSLALYLSGDARGALRELETVSGAPSAGFNLYRASLALSVGEVDAAQAALKDFEKLTAASPAEARPALLAGERSINSIISLTRNDKEAAYKAASEARTHSAASSAGGLALSFAEQARFNLDGAYDALKSALEQNQDNPFLLARLAEVALGFGRSEEAEEHLGHALRVAPEHPYTLSVLGFLRLIQDNAKEAQGLFEKTMEKNQGDALGYLGLGLALIRQGEVIPGRANLERAVHLAPNVSVYRSYLGKAFFEEDREALSEKEYNQAIDLDPRDPTPYLYRAFTHLSENRPVSALRDVERSIELNDARAVYRSSFLLDQDLGVRSASLADVFNSLGFTAVARTEAIKSINHDYGNYSAHRLLGESYNTNLTNDAQLSELGIVDLLSPLSFNSFRSASSEASLNNYSALFDRDGKRHEIEGNFGTQNDSIGGHVGQSGKNGALGHYVSYDFFNADGTTHNNYTGEHRLRGAMQYQLSQNDRLLFDVRFRERAETDNIKEFREERFEQFDSTLGYNHQFSPHTRFIFQTTYSREHLKFENPVALSTEGFGFVILGDTSFFEDDFIKDLQFRDKLNESRSSAQVIYDSDMVSLVAGSEVFFADILRRERSKITDDVQQLFSGLGLYSSTKGESDLDTQSTYLYSTWHLAKWLDLNLGLGYADVELEETEIPPYAGGTYNHSRWNPKLGAVVYLSPETTLKGAYFEDLRKSSLEDAVTLEPTFVGGINQRFTDKTGVRSRNYAAGFDHKILAGTYFGSQWIHRDLVEDIGLIEPVYLIDLDNYTTTYNANYFGREDDHQDVDIVDTYFYQVLAENWVAALDYKFSLFENTDPELAQRIQDHIVGLGIRRFHSDGVFSFVKGTWLEQNRSGGSTSGSSADVGSDGDQETIIGNVDDGVSEVFLLDAGVGYRIPHRQGVITFSVKNILDQEFAYDPSSGLIRDIFPTITFELLASVNF